jgi:hypothetical protein
MRPLALVFVLLLVAVDAAAERRWQTGTWADVGVKRRVVDFGPGASGFGRPNSTPAMRAMADVHTYVIEAGNQRFELEDVVQVGRLSVDAVVGQSVTFAVDKKTVYVRDANSAEHRLRLVKKTQKTAS